MNIEDELKQLHARNRRVELDKAWETSITRRLTIATITYICALGVLLLIDAPRAPLAALVPVAGFVLSTLTMRPIRRFWERFKD